MLSNADFDYKFNPGCWSKNLRLSMKATGLRLVY